MSIKFALLIFFATLLDSSDAAGFRVCNFNNTDPNRDARCADNPRTRCHCLTLRSLCTSLCTSLSHRTLRFCLTRCASLSHSAPLCLTPPACLPHSTPFCLTPRLSASPALQVCCIRTSGSPKAGADRRSGSSIRQNVLLLARFH